jgi:hypothetical protein
MAWEWIAPLATTIGGTLVGLAGIIATVRAAKGQRELLDRLSRREQEHRYHIELRATRREVYAQFINAAFEAINEARGQSDKLKALLIALHQVQVVASDDVEEHALDLYGAAAGVRDRKRRHKDPNTEDLDDPDEDVVEDPGVNFIEAEQALVEAIRKEIGMGLPEGTL